MDSLLLNSIESFPPLKESVQTINLLCNHENIDLKALASVIESDPLLYTDILHFTNAPEYGFRLPITSVFQAISLLGPQTVRGMAISAALKAHPYTDLTPYSISAEQWFETMKSQQTFLNEWIIRLDRSLFIKLGAVIYILEIGRLVTSYLLHLSHRSYRFDANDPFELMFEEKKLLGSSADQLAARLFKQWNFEPIIIDLIENSLSPERSKLPKMAAMLTCARILFTLKETRSFETAEPLIEQYGLDPVPILSAYDALVSRS